MFGTQVGKAKEEKNKCNKRDTLSGKDGLIIEK
jgi:hypothetical protein